MRRAVIFQASVVCAAVVFIYAIEGKQTRRARDEEFQRAAAAQARTPVTVAVVDARQDGGSAVSSPLDPDDLEKGKILEEQRAV